VYKAAPVKKGGHRALQDIRESVAELAYYRDAFFRPAALGPRPGAAATAGETDPQPDPEEATP